MTDSVRKLFDNFLFKVKATWLIEYINLKILEPIQQAQQIAQNMLNTVMAYLRTAPQEIYLTQAQYDALPDTEEEMQPGDLYYKMDPTKAFNIEEEQEEGSGNEGGAA